jgi:hypothetical protein
MSDRFDADVVYATFDNRKRDDFKPYVLKSTDRGDSWISISANLPENGTVHTIEQDPEVPGLLFVGTEFGFYFSIDGGEAWTKLTSGLPTIAVRDMTIQEQKNDLVLATFGRGFYILDDYTPIRELAMEKAILDQEAHIFTVTDALMYIRTGGKYGQGSSFYKAKNPEFGTTFTYYLKEVPKTLKAERQEKEKELFKEKKPIPQPAREELRLEEAEEAPYLVFAIRDAAGAGIRKLYKKASKGVNRINWDLRYSSTRPVSVVTSRSEKVESSSGSTLAMPGEYSVELYIVARGEVTQLVDAVPFRTKLLNQATLPAKNYQEVVDFQAEVSELSRVMSGTRQMAREQQVKLNTIRKVIKQTPGTGASMLADVLALQDQLDRPAGDPQRGVSAGTGEAKRGGGWNCQS